jgi:hypothetical protein
VLAGLLLVVGGGLIAVGAREDWLLVHVPRGGTMALNEAGSRFGNALLVFAALIVILGLVRIGRGFAEDRMLHRIAFYVSVAAIAAILVRSAIFLSDHDLSIGDLDSYQHVDLRLGVYLLAAGVVVTLVSRWA